MRRSVFAFSCFSPPARVHASAQETGTPVFKAPYRAFQAHEFGANLSFPEGAADFGLEGFYTYGYNRFDIGLRGGIVSYDAALGDDDTQDRARRQLPRPRARGHPELPARWGAHPRIGTQFGEGTDFVLIPVGISLGRRLQLEGSRVSFVPYVHPVFVPTIGGGDSEVNFALGLGADIRFSDTIDLRVSAGIGDIEGVALGLAFVR